MAAQHYEVGVKVKTFGQQCEDAGLVLVPMVVEVFGRWGQRAEEVFKLISKACSNRASETSKAAGAHIRRSFSICLQRLNARILLSRSNPLAEVFGEPLALPASRLPHPSQSDEVAETLAALDAAPPALAEAFRCSWAGGFLSWADKAALAAAVRWAGPWLMISTG